MPATMEFASSTAYAEKRPTPRPTSAAAMATPWVPPGPSRHHKAPTLPSKAELAEQAMRAEAAAADEAARLGVHVDAAESAMTRLEGSLDGMVAVVEEHILSASAANVLVSKRLGELGLLL